MGTTELWETLKRHSQSGCDRAKLAKAFYAVREDMAKGNIGTPEMFIQILVNLVQHHLSYSGDFLQSVRIYKDSGVSLQVFSDFFIAVQGQEDWVYAVHKATGNVSKSLQYVEEQLN